MFMHPIFGYGSAHNLRNPRGKKAERFFMQRVERGFDDSEFFALDRTIIWFLHDRISLVIEKDLYAIGTYAEKEEWRRDMRIILEGLDGFVEGQFTDNHNDHKKADALRLSFELLSKNLWKMWG